MLSKREIREILFLIKKFFTSPKLHLHVDQNSGEELKNNQEKCSITYIGQATCLIQIDGINILTDPNWAYHLSYIPRYSLPGIRFENLPHIDLILISHAHFDHLHKNTLRRFRNDIPIITEKSVLPILRKIPGIHTGAEIGDSIDFEGLKIHLVPVKHWGARYVLDRHRKCTGFIIEGKRKKIFFPGDTTYHKDFQKIGKKFKPDITLVPIGDYLPKEINKFHHMNPEEVLEFTKDLASQVNIPIHWGTFKLSKDDLHTPLRDVEKIARQHSMWKFFHVLKHGQTWWEK